MNISTQERFQQLDQLLLRHWSAWQPAFGSDAKLWLTEATLTAIAHELGSATQLTSSPLLPIQSEPPAGTKLRKWRQLQHFKGCFNSSAETIVDWCCGMGHLSGHLASDRHAVIGLEIDSSLIARASARSSKMTLFHQCDVLSEAEQYLSSAQSIVALHACGALHTALVEKAVESQVHDLHFSPCCYHKRFNRGLKMLSQPARRSPLVLNERNIQLAVRQSVTAPKREQFAREKLRLYRLGFDEWVKRELGIEHYTHLPSTSPAIATKGFATFCAWGAKQRVPELSGVAVNDESRLLSSAEERLELEVAYEAQCEVFRRALEIRLCLDNVLFLEENGFQAELIEFCPSSITPRNIMIRAFRA
ncbi:methyltransferase [uncultured Umboniibacter sp.]|uniref:methyltransferase n=1 Tax=uncultured Umboniibacter sp. TaxID=1798917 RepID=UPI00261BF50F|nr:methyltransferase [uncultured Umboniibacter sp.]